MAINLDFRAPPAFDRSIVPAYQVNFNRIRDAFLHTGTQLSFVTGGAGGPWPVTANILVPYKCDVFIWNNASYYTNAAPAQIAMQIKWDGANLGLLEMFHNENFSHKNFSNIVEARSVQPGNHTLAIDALTGGVISDANDRWRYCCVFVEVF